MTGLGGPPDPLARLREQRLHEIMRGLIPRLRPLFPDMPDDLFQELVERMAETQARDEQQDWGELYSATRSIRG